MDVYPLLYRSYALLNVLYMNCIFIYVDSTIGTGRNKSGVCGIHVHVPNRIRYAYTCI